MSRPITVRAIDDEQARLLQIVYRGGSRPVVTWRRARMVCDLRPGMETAAIAEVAFTAPNRVR